MLPTKKNWFANARQRRPHHVAIFITLAMATTLAPVSAADFENGLKAFRAGEIQQALEEWEPLAKAGDPKAQHAIGMMYEYGHGFERDDEKAATWYEKAAAQNLPEAQYRLGVFYDNGWGVARDPVLAVTWYERAAKRGHAFAQHDLAFMHFDGRGVPEDRIQAYKWLKIASVQEADLMLKHLFNVSKTMTAEEIGEAERLARVWLNSKEL